MRLYLSGGSKRAFSLDEKFVRALDPQKPLMYIPIALTNKKRSYGKCFDWFKSYFAGCGLRNIEMVLDLTAISESDLDRYCGIYIGGGNTFRLLDQIRSQHFDRLIEKAVEKDMPVVGNSAGSIIHGHSIASSIPYSTNDASLSDLDGLNHLHGYDLWCHYEQNMDQLIREYCRNGKVQKVIALPDYCGLLVRDDAMTVYGESSAWLFDSDGKKVELSAGSRIDLGNKLWL